MYAGRAWGRAVGPPSPKDRVNQAQPVHMFTDATTITILQLAPATTSSSDDLPFLGRGFDITTKPGGHLHIPRSAL